MAKVKRTLDYLNQLQSSGYPKSDHFIDLYRTWKTSRNLKIFSQYLNELLDEKDGIKPKYLGENTYSNLRGISFEEFCFDVLTRTVQENTPSFDVEVFWNERILTEELYLFENGEFKKHPKSKAVDLILGVPQEARIHPFVIISCKVWQGTNWLDEDRSTLDRIRIRYPAVIGYSLCMSANVPPVSLISAQRTGLRVLDFSQESQVDEFVSDIKELLMGLSDK